MFRIAPILLVLSVGVFALATAAAPRASSSAPGIDNIAAFLEQCPTNDPAYAQIRTDFEIRREGVIVGAIPCTEPISAMPISQYTDELIAAQTLRTIYYMEGGRNVAYPWTSGSLYDWMKTKIGGIDLRVNGSYCCSSFNDEWYPVIVTQQDWDRNDDRVWQGISNQITLLAHETRHVDGYPHVGYCPLFPDQPNGCDQEYDESNLSPYAIEWWLNEQWLSGELYVGFSCAAPSTVSAIANFHQSVDNQNYALRFVGASPPSLSIPAPPGGACQQTGQTPMPTASPTHTPSPTPTHTPSPTPTLAHTPSPTPTLAPTPTHTPSPTPTGARTATPTVTASPTTGATPTPTATPQPTTEPTPPITTTHAPTAAPTPSGPPLSPPPGPTGTPTASAAPTDAPSPTASPPAQGNVNCDGATDQRDLLLMLQANGGLEYTRPAGCVAPGEHVGDVTVGDVDCDGAFDLRDVLALLRYLSGLPSGGC